MYDSINSIFDHQFRIRNSHSDNDIDLNRKSTIIANIITVIRVLINIALLLCSVFSPVFYMFYMIAGTSDMADGTIARRTNTVSEFGARFDTLADTIFAVVCLIKILPAISIHMGVYVQ